MTNNKPGSFLDPKSIFAIFFVGLSWFVWDGYMKKKYPHLYKEKTEQTTDVNSDKVVNSSSENKVNSDIVVKQDTAQAIAPGTAERLTSFQSDNLNFDISSHGMGIKNIVLNKYFDREKKVKKLSTNLSTLPFETNVLGNKQKLSFNVTKVSDNRYQGVANYNGVPITKTVEIHPESYSIKIKVSSVGFSNDFKGVKFYLPGEKVESETSIMMPMMGGQELFVKYENTNERLMGDAIFEENLNLKNVSIVNLGETYFSMAMINNSNTYPTFNQINEAEKVIGQLNYPVLNYDDNKQDVLVSAFIGPKDVNYLNKIDKGLSEIIDYGWFDIIARWLLKLLKLLYGFVGNWGFAIVLMTLIIKIILLPLNIYSAKSMKRMQRIQPEIKAIREKLKGNPQEMNMKVMGLMKENKANPVSGCLPMLLQFPIFFAFYRVLGQSIELYQAPFMLWLQDLSLKDPYYILPVLMSIAMFFQMKISPSAMDPMQKKIMMFMPLIFGVFMLGLPSGLTLYIFISTLFGIIQHFILMRDTSMSQPALSKA